MADESESSEPRRALKSLLAGVAEDRWSELPGLYAEDAVVEHPLALRPPTRLEGRAALAEHFERAARAPLALRAERLVVHQTTDPELIVGEFQYVGENTATGAPFMVNNIFVMRVRDGLIVESRDYMDHCALARVLSAEGNA